MKKAIIILWGVILVANLFGQNRSGIDNTKESKKQEGTVATFSKALSEIGKSIDIFLANIEQTIVDTQKSDKSIVKKDELFITILSAFLLVLMGLSVLIFRRSIKREKAEITLTLDNIKKSIRGFKANAGLKPEVPINELTPTKVKHVPDEIQKIWTKEEKQDKVFPVNFFYEFDQIMLLNLKRELTEKYRCTNGIYKIYQRNCQYYELPEREKNLLQNIIIVHDEGYRNGYNNFYPELEKILSSVKPDRKRIPEDQQEPFFASVFKIRLGLLRFIKDYAKSKFKLIKMYFAYPW